MNQNDTTTQRPISRVQIAKYVTKDRILDISDMLNLEPRRSKVAINLIEYNEQTKKRETVVRHYLDVGDCKLIMRDIMGCNFSEFTDHKGSEVDGEMQARVLTIRKDVKYRQPFVIKIDNGVGERMNGGNVKMVRATDSLTLLMPEWDARILAMTVYDYIFQWETIHFKKRQEAQTIMVSPVGEGG